MFPASLAFTVVMAASPNGSAQYYAAPMYLPRAEIRADASRSSCESDRSLCFDPSSGRIVYKPARALMPSIPGLQRENISVKRDKIILRYSF